MKRRLAVSVLLTLMISLAAFAPAHAAESAEAGAELGMTHRMMMLALQLGLILFAARMGAIVFEKLKLPGVLGELAAGMLIGPHLLGGLSFYGFAHGLFPAHGPFPVSAELYGLCAIASIVLLFMVGLETDTGMFMRYSVAGSLVGLGGVIASFVLGDLAAMVFSPMVFGERLGFMAPSCLFLGIISTATSVGITARILSERRKMDSPEGVTILAGAVIDDILGIIALAVTLGILAASRTAAADGTVDWGHIAMIAVKAVGIWLCATVAGLLAARRISVLLKLLGDRMSIAIMALGLALVLAGLFEEAGLAMIIGAYVMGLSISKSDIAHVVHEKLDAVYRLLVPVFFCVMGMLVDFHAMSSGPVIVFGLVYTVVAVAAKMIGCGIPALFCNFNLRGALRIGCGMVPRGEVALIVAGIGLAGGHFSTEVFGIAIIMTAITTMAAPPALVAAFANPASGARRPAPRTEESEVVFHLPGGETTELLMNKLAAVLESEGFFVHLLNHEQKIHQIRKDDVIITYSYTEDRLVFNCKKQDMPFIDTAMYEVMAEMERIVRDLRKPEGAEQIARRIQIEDKALSPRRLDLSAYLCPPLLEPALASTTKRDVLVELVEMLRRQGCVRDAEAAMRAILERESSLSTGMQYGIAIPHGRTDAVDRLVCAIGISRGGIEFDSIDGKPARIFILTLSPRTGTSPHVQFMATISRTLDADMRARLLTCRTSGQMREVLLAPRQNGKEAGPAAPTPSAPPAPREAQPHSASNASRQSSFEQALRPELICLELAGSTKDEVIDELLGLLERSGRLADREAARAAVLARERQMSTGLESGVAIPHGRVDGVPNLVCALGVKHEGVAFEAADRQPSRIIALTLAPKGQGAAYVEFMAAITRFMDGNGRQMVLAATDPLQLWREMAAAIGAAG